MNLRSRKQKLVSEINITPFTDVILVLLVIFMVSTPLIYQTSIKVKLPEAKGSGNEKPDPNEVTVTITNENMIYLDKVLMTRKELKSRLSALHKITPDLKVILYADRLVQFKDIVEVLDAFTEVGITRLDIAAVTKQ